MKARFLSEKEVARLCAVCREKIWLPFEVSTLTGLRIGDVLKIKSGDLCADDMCISYTAEKTGKSGQAFIPRSLMERLILAASESENEYIFSSPIKKGEHLTRQAAWRRIKRACLRAGIAPDGVSPHSMRKVFAVDLYKREGMTAVKTYLQHSNIDVTEIYALADFLSAENENKPLLRGDIARVIRICEQNVIAKLKGG